LLCHVPQEKVKAWLADTPEKCIARKGSIPGTARRECGNYRGLSLAAGQAECREFLPVVKVISTNEFTYPEA